MSEQILFWCVLCLKPLIYCFFAVAYSLHLQITCYSSCCFLCTKSLLLVPPLVLISASLILDPLFSIHCSLMFSLSPVSLSLLALSFICRMSCFFFMVSIFIFCPFHDLTLLFAHQPKLPLSRLYLSLPLFCPCLSLCSCTLKDPCCIILLIKAWAESREAEDGDKDKAVAATAAFKPH